MIDTKLKNFVINTLRRASFRWKPRGESEKKFKIQIGEFKTGRPKYGYYCAICGEINKKKDTSTDHIDPVIPVEGFSGFDDYIERLFCDESNFQVICKECHNTKTKSETQARKEYRKNMKEKK